MYKNRKLHSFRTVIDFWSITFNVIDNITIDFFNIPSSQACLTLIYRQPMARIAAASKACGSVRCTIYTSQGEAALPQVYSQLKCSDHCMECHFTIRRVPLAQGLVPAGDGCGKLRVFDDGTVSSFFVHRWIQAFQEPRYQSQVTGIDHQVLKPEGFDHEVYGLLIMIRNTWS